MTEQYVDVRGTSIRMARGGDGPPLIFLDTADAGARWLPFHEGLATRFTVYAPCHPGHGGSPAAEWIEHISDLAFHVLDLIDALDLDRVYLAGASFGGWVAAETATMASDRLLALALVDPVGIKVDGWTYPFLFGMELPDTLDLVFHNLRAVPTRGPRQDVETLVTQYRQDTAVARVSWDPYMYNPLLRRRLGRIDAPTLLCWGANDRIAPLDRCGQAWMQAIPGARMAAFQESGHVPHLEEPEAVARAITDFCAAAEEDGK